MHLSFVLLKSTLCLALITALLDTAVGVPIPQFGPAFKEAFQQAARDPNSGVGYNRFTGNHYTHNGRTVNEDPRTASSSGRQRTTDDYSGQGGPDSQGTYSNSFQTTHTVISGQGNKGGHTTTNHHYNPRSQGRRPSRSGSWDNSGMSSPPMRQPQGPNAGRRPDDGGYPDPRRQEPYNRQRRPSSDSGIPIGRSGGEPTGRQDGPSSIDVLRASKPQPEVKKDNNPSRPQQQDAGTPRTQQPQSGSNPPSRQQPYAGDAGRPSGNAGQSTTRRPAPPVSRPVPTRQRSVGASGNPAQENSSGTPTQARPAAAAPNSSGPKQKEATAEECASPTAEQKKSDGFRARCRKFLGK